MIIGVVNDLNLILDVVKFMVMFFFLLKYILIIIMVGVYVKLCLNFEKEFDFFYI